MGTVRRHKLALHSNESKIVARVDEIDSLLTVAGCTALRLTEATQQLS